MDVFFDGVILVYSVSPDQKILAVCSKLVQCGRMIFSSTGTASHVVHSLGVCHYHKTHIISQDYPAQGCTFRPILGQEYSLALPIGPLDVLCRIILLVNW